MMSCSSRAIRCALVDDRLARRLGLLLLELDGAAPPRSAHATTGPRTIEPATHAIVMNAITPPTGPSWVGMPPGRQAPDRQDTSRPAVWPSRDLAR